MLIFLLQSSFVLSVLYFLYFVTLRRTTLHALSRAVLLLVVTCSLLLPAFRLTLSEGNSVLAHFRHIENTICRTLSSAPTVQRVQWVSLQQTEPATTETALPFTVGEALLFLYCLVTFVLLLRYLLSLLHYAQLLCQSRRAFRVGKVRVYVHPAVASPISWGRTVVLSPADLRADRETTVHDAAHSSSRLRFPLLRHELAHIRLCHTPDRLLCDVAARLWWFCPAAWWLRADLEALHEFQADADVVQHGVARKLYGTLLVQKVVNPHPFCAVHGWRASQIKRRLRMLYARRSRPVVAWRVLLLLPAVFLMAFCLAVPAEVMHAVQQVLPPMTASAIAKSAVAFPSAVEPPTEFVELSEVAEPALPADAKSEEAAEQYVSRRLCTESIDKLASDFGLPADENYTTIVTINEVTDVSALQYRVNDTPCDAATFARHAAVHFDEAHATVWAFGKQGSHSGLKALPRLYARQHYGVDAEVLVVYTDETPLVNPPEERRLVTNGTDLYTVTTIYNKE